MTVKDRIIEEASELFSQSGVRSITMDELAKHLGISKRTIYENFKDKEDLLIACIDAFHEEGRKFQEKVFQTSENVVEAILAILPDTVGQTTQRQINMMNDIRKYYPQVYKERFTHFHNEQCGNMEQMIWRGIKEGVFHEDLKPEIIAHFFSKQGESIINNRYLEKFSISDIIENIAFTFFRGICTEKGTKIIDNYKKNK